MTNTNNIKVVVLRGKLLDGLGSLERSLGSGAGLPILGCVLLEARGGEMRLVTTDLEVVTEYTVTCKVIQEGAIAVPFSVFSGIIRNLASERVTFTMRDTTLEAATDNYEAVMNGQPAGDFPLVPSFEAGHSAFSLSVSDFIEFLAQTTHATQYSEVRPEISGVYATIKDGRLIFAATDSFRLAERKVDPGMFRYKGERDFSFIIPFKTASALNRIFARGEGQIDVLFDDNQVRFRTENLSLTSRLVDGRYPDYVQIIPGGYESHAVLNRGEFLGAVKIVSSFSGRGSDVSVKTGDNGKFLEVCASDGVLGNNIYRIPAKTDGDSFSVTLNWRYVLDGLKAFRGDEVQIGVNSTDKPVGLSDRTMPYLTYIMMPIKS